MEMVVEDLYGPLGLTPGATLEQVRDAYRKLVRQYHPDRYAEAPREFQEVARVRTAELNEAYRLISARLAPVNGRQDAGVSA